MTLSGEVVWAQQLSGRIIDNPAISVQGAFVVGTETGIVYRVNIASGAVLWEKSFGDAISHPLVLVDENIRVRGNRMASVDLSGTRIWERDFSGEEIVPPGNDLMVFDDRIHIIDKVTGETKRMYTKEEGVYVYGSAKDIFKSRNSSFERIQ